MVNRRSCYIPIPNSRITDAHPTSRQHAVITPPCHQIPVTYHLYIFAGAPAGGYPIPLAVQFGTKTLRSYNQAAELNSE